MKAEGRFHLLPSLRQQHSSLRSVYREAFAKASELSIVSAYFTEWQGDLRLNRHCTSFQLIVGTDFGTTRKSALEAVLEWLPQRFRNALKAYSVDGVPFHPKAMLWQEHGGGRFMLLGSSNLTKAAFERNVEANVVLRLTTREYGVAKGWFSKIDSDAETVNEEWLETYVEAPPQSGKRKAAGERTDSTDVSLASDLSLRLANARERSKFKKMLEQRRSQKAAFSSGSRKPLLSLLRWAADKKRWYKRDGLEFYAQLRTLWGDGHSRRMGGDQWQITGMRANHRELARSLVAVLDAQASERDGVVRQERNRLQKLGVSTRGAVFTELLCHFFPKQYPIVDAPIRAWRSHVGFDKGLGGLEGDRYLRLANAMRQVLKDDAVRRLGVSDLAELDALIWVKFAPKPKAIN